MVHSLLLHGADPNLHPHVSMIVELQQLLKNVPSFTKKNVFLLYFQNTTTLQLLLEQIRKRGLDLGLLELLMIAGYRGRCEDIDECRKMAMEHPEQKIWRWLLLQMEGTNTLQHLCFQAIRKYLLYCTKGASVKSRIKTLASRLPKLMRSKLLLQNCIFYKGRTE